MPLPVVGKAHEAAGGQPFYWFIYGSSLSRRAFGDWAAQHGYALPDFTKAVPARLLDHRLSFDIVSRFWGGAVASLAVAPGRSVEGLALPLPGEARGLSDHKEGAISGLYEPFEVEVVPLVGGDPLRALAYRAASARKLPREERPSMAFMKVLMEGARDNGLTPTYLAELDALAR
ncbi:MAG: gamma-glutamylcyclotransferase family protein [Deltaproteobacteria bacterium]